MSGAHSASPSPRRRAVPALTLLWVGLAASAGAHSQGAGARYGQAYETPSPMLSWYLQQHTGPGFQKWPHYFEPYERHPVPGTRVQYERHHRPPPFDKVMYFYVPGI